MTTENEQHNDILRRQVKVDDYVAFTHHNTLKIGKVIKVHNKKITVLDINHGTKSQWDTGEYLKYTNQCAIIGGPELTRYLLVK